MKVGLDFGTTNSALSYIDGEDVKVLSFGGTQDSYIPSVVAVKHKPKKKKSFGHAAKAQMGQPKDKVSVYSNFKMLLGERDNAVKQKWGYCDQYTPEWATEQYIKSLVDDLSSEHHIQASNIVVTVPEIWVREGLQLKQEKLFNSLRKVGINNVKLESEPLAAATYFLDRYKNKKSQPFNGHLLVCDCGGGTMDFCLVEISHQQSDKPDMKVLERAGNGQVSDSLGSAGVAFDEAVIDHLYPDLRKTNSAKFFKMASEFERLKILNTEDVSEYFDDYFKSREDLDEEVFALDDQPVTTADLNTIFKQLISPGIVKALNEIKDRAADHPNLSLADPNGFRVVMVGGFSRFFLVKKTIRDFFNSKTLQDNRFEEMFTLQDTALAISKGAALIANDMINIRQTCPVDLGLIVLKAKIDENIEFTRPQDLREFIIVLEKGKMVSDYQTACYYPTPFQVLNSAQSLELCIQFKKGSQIPLKLDHLSLNQVLPDNHSKSSKLTIGFSIDHNMMFHIHVQNWLHWPARKGEKPAGEKVTSLGNLLSQVPNLVEC